VHFYLPGGVRCSHAAGCGAARAARYYNSPAAAAASAAVRQITDQ